jgi:methyl-accepting chemotaxis protein
MQRTTGPAAKGSTTQAAVNGISASKETGDISPVLIELLSALQAVRNGDFSVRMSGDSIGIEGKIADTFNDIIASNQRMAEQLERVGEVVGREGKTKQRVKFGVTSGAWVDMENSINTLIDDLVWPTTEVTRAITAVAQGDLIKTVPLDVDGRPLKGEFLRSATIVNTMIKQLGVFTSEVTRVAREVGTEGKLGGQAIVPGVSGEWNERSY